MINISYWWPFSLPLFRSILVVKFPLSHNIFDSNTAQLFIHLSVDLKVWAVIIFAILITNLALNPVEHESEFRVK